MNGSHALDMPSDGARQLSDNGRSAARTRGGPAEAGAVAIDPVCGMRVDPASTPYRLAHAGNELYLCSAHCLKAFIDTAVAPTGR